MLFSYDSYNRIHYRNTNDCKIDLTDLTLNEDIIGYYLSAKYRVEDANSIRELDFPKIRLPINRNEVTVRTNIHGWPSPEVDIGFGFRDLYRPNSCADAYFTETVVNEKTREMTIAEIEERLGYKIKIVEE